MTQTQATPEFYQAFSPTEIKELVQGINNSKAIPFKFVYRGKIIQKWQDLVIQQTQAPFSTIKSDLKFLKEGLLWLDEQQNPFKPAYIIDIGAGNSEPVKELIGFVSKAGMLKEYIAIDISPEMLELSKNNINQWFGNISFSSYLLDVEKESLSSITAQIDHSTEEQKLFVYVGGTISNHENRLQVLTNIASSLQNDEFLLMSCSLRFQGAENQYNIKNHISVDAAYYLAELLAIAPQDMTIKGYFNSETQYFLTDIIFKTPYEITLNVKGKPQTLTFSQGDHLNIYRYYCYEIDSDNNIDFLLQECNQAGLTVASYNLDILLSRVMIIAQRTQE